jgi:hypothetical protein
MKVPGAYWRPKTVGDLETALRSDLLDENHFMDLKRELEPGKKANTIWRRTSQHLRSTGGWY